jgi:hypothetical protein
MKPFRFQVDRLIDFGTIVSMIGIDADTGKPVTVHVHRPFAEFWAAWCEVGLPQPIEYDADRLTLSLGPVGDDDGEVASDG